MADTDKGGAEPLAGRLGGLDRLLEHRSRLAICVLLSREPKISFSRFKALLDETDGNLGAHLRRLEDQGYVAVDKTFVDRKPQSVYSLTNEGRCRLKAHLDGLQELIAVGAAG